MEPAVRLRSKIEDLVTLILKSVRSFGFVHDIMFCLKILFSTIQFILYFQTGSKCKQKKFNLIINLQLYQYTNLKNYCYYIFAYLLLLLLHFPLICLFVCLSVWFNCML